MKSWISNVQKKEFVPQNIPTPIFFVIFEISSLVKTYNPRLTNLGCFDRTRIYRFRHSSSLDFSRNWMTVYRGWEWGVVNQSCLAPVHFDQISSTTSLYPNCSKGSSSVLCVARIFHSFTKTIFFSNCQLKKVWRITIRSQETFITALRFTLSELRAKGLSIAKVYF